MTPVEAAVILILLHGLDGRIIYVNPQEITSLHAKMDTNKLLTESAQCVVNLVDGKFITVKETCEAIERMMK